MQTTDTAKGRFHFPFNGEQVVNIASELGPLCAMFIVNGVYGIAAGTWALIVCTILSLVASLWVLGRPPVMPFIAGAVSVTFGALTLITGDAMWVQIKVTIFNALVAAVLWFGLKMGHNFFKFVFGKTFHYTVEGWEKMTRNVAIFFLVTAIVNEAVRLNCGKWHIHLLNRVITGVDIWILFKIVVIMPLTALFFVWQVRLLQKYRLPEPVQGTAGGTGLDRAV
ncbi:MAG: septation protein A [Hyphomicrobiales bacterium]|jgi:intracellular septation protein|nr:MAG: septation protein A [Hyphomicrobiales bacterium]